MDVDTFETRGVTVRKYYLKAGDAEAYIDISKQTIIDSFDFYSELLRDYQRREYSMVRYVKGLFWNDYKIMQNQKSEAQIRLEEKLERDRAKLQEQIRKDQKKIEELKRKAKSIIGEMFAEYLPDYYCFEGSELKEIIDAAMNQEIVLNKISEIRNRDSTDEADGYLLE